MNKEISEMILEHLNNIKEDLIERYLETVKNEIIEISPNTLKEILMLGGVELPNNVNIENAFKAGENDISRRF